MLNYSKLAAHSPFVYAEFVNSKGQAIKLAEHPIKGDEAEVIVMCDELQLAAYSTFFETDDMLADHKEYEPSFVDGKLYIGDMATD